MKGIKSEFPEFEPKNFLTDKGLNEKTSNILPVFSTMLALADDFRTIDWVNEYPFPSIALEEIKSLLVN